MCGICGFVFPPWHRQLAERWLRSPLKALMRKPSKMLISLRMFQPRHRRHQSAVAGSTACSYVTFAA